MSLGQLLSFPVRCGALGISVSVASVVDLYAASQHATKVAFGTIKQVYPFQIGIHDDNSVFCSETLSSAS